MKYGTALWIVRALLGGLVSFEVAGLLGFFPAIDERVWPGLLFVSVVSWAVLEWVDRWMRTRGLPRPPALVVLVGILVVYIDAVGNLAGLYQSIQRYDVVVHAASGLALTAVLFYAVRNIARVYRVNMGPVSWGYIAWTTMLVLAVLFEIGEWVADVVFGISFWLGSAQDTLGDLISAMVGGTVALLAIGAARRHKAKRQRR